MFIFTCALISLATTKDDKSKSFRDWLIYLVIFVVATLNKETSIIQLITFTIVYFNKLDRRTFAGLPAIQILAYGLIRLYLFQLFAQNPGSIAVSYWRLYTKIPTVIPITLILFSLILLPMKIGWRYKPLFLRQAVVMAAPLVVLFFLFGYPLELRVFLEVYPVIFLLLLPYKYSNPVGSTFRHKFSLFSDSIKKRM